MDGTENVLVMPDGVQIKFKLDSTNQLPTDVPFHWTPKATRLLISLRGDFDEQFESRSCPKKRVWDQIATRMKEMGGYAVDSDACSKKWSNLMITYRRITDSVKESGKIASSWEFYCEMKAIQGSKLSLEPPASHLSSSLESSRRKPKTPKPFRPIPICDIVSLEEIVSDDQAESLPSSTKNGHTVIASAPCRSGIGESNARKRTVASDDAPKWFKKFADANLENQRRRLELEERRLQLDEASIRVLEKLNSLLESMIQKQD